MRYRILIRKYIIPFLDRDWIKFLVPILIFGFTALANIIEGQSLNQEVFSANTIDPVTRTFILGEIDQYTPIIEERRDIDRVNMLEESEEFVVRKPTIVKTEFTPEKIEKTETERNKTITHLVQPGETLSGIGAKYNLKMKTLLAANQNLKNADSLAINDKLIIPIENYDSNYADKLIAKKEAKFQRSTTTTKTNLTKTTGLSKVVPGGGCTKPVAYDYVSRRLSKYHQGVDMIASIGRQVYAACSGTVIAAAAGWSGGFGIHVKIAQDNGDVSIYAHLSSISNAINVGQHIEAGTYLGGVGSTGRSTGSHLHFEVKRAGRAIDYGY